MGHIKAMRSQGHNGLSEKLVLTSVNDFWLNKIAIFDNAGQSNRIKSNIMRANEINGWWVGDPLGFMLDKSNLTVAFQNFESNNCIIKNFQLFPKF